MDNTLYDWVSFYAQSFTAMLDVLVNILDVPKSELLEEFRRTFLNIDAMVIEELSDLFFGLW